MNAIEQKGRHSSAARPAASSWSASGLARDVRFACRGLRHNPGFTLVAVLILALGIGANTAVFSLLSAVVLRPLPFAEPDRLVVLWDDFTSAGGPAAVEPTAADFVEWKRRAHSFADMALMESTTYNLTGGGDPEKLNGLRTTPNLFSLLGMQPLLGRTFSADDEGPDALPVVVISRSLWMSRFGGERSIVGRSIVLDGSKRTVIGVVPDDFRFPKLPDRSDALWVPASFTPRELAARTAYVMNVVARLAPGVSLGQARAEMTSIARGLARERSNDGRVGVGVVPLRAQLADGVRPVLFILLGAVGMVLLITCANVANLLLARGASRQKELALRQVLGAGQARMLQQLLTESTLLAVLGLAGGVALSTASFGYLARLIPDTLPQGTHPSLDWRVLAFSAAVTLLTVLLFGTGPAVAAARMGFGAALKKGGIGRASTTGAARARRVLVVAEITLTVVLLVGAGLLLRSYAAVLGVDPGFRPQHLLLAQTQLSAPKYADFAARRAFYQGVLARVAALPGVTSAGYATYPPLLFKGGRTLISVEGQPAPKPSDMLKYAPLDRAVSASYFATLGVPVVRGRAFDRRDAPDSAPSALVNAAMAARYWPRENPIGKRFRVGRANGTFSPWVTVVGVVADIREMGFEAPVDPEFYLSLNQSNVEATFLWPNYLVVRTEGDPSGLGNAVRKAVWDVDANQPVANVQPMTAVFDAELSARSTQLTLVGGLAALALLLASIGLYGVLAYTVVQRTSEIGLRVALGARRANVVGAVVRNALAMAVLGIGVGLAGAFAVSRFISAFLFGVSPSDPVTYAAVTASLVIVSALAAYVPARKAAAVDPMTALRVE